MNDIYYNHIFVAKYISSQTYTIFLEIHAYNATSANNLRLIFLERTKNYIHVL